LRPEFTLHQGAKALIIKAKTESGEKFIMLVFPADLKFDNKKVKTILGAKNINFATEEEINNLTNGVQVGGVPPFGNLFNTEVFADEQLFDNEEIIFNAGDRSFSITMKSEDYKTLVNPHVCEII
jgi:Ala-tRNA(Pro) deacylase